MNGLQALSRALSGLVADAQNGNGRRPLVRDGEWRPGYQTLFSNRLANVSLENVIGGIGNTLSGAGGEADKVATAHWKPSWFTTRHPLDYVYGESWAAEKIVDIPGTDMFLRWRTWDTPAMEPEEEGKEEALKKGQSDGEAMEEGERDAMVREKLWDLVRCGRLYGTGLIVMMTDEDDMDTPLDLNRVREGGLLNLFCTDRFAATAREWEADPYSPNYSYPEHYIITPQYGQGSEFEAHWTRVIRYDGKRMPRESFSYRHTWGNPVLITAMAPIIQDALTSGAVAHMLQEFSIPVIKNPSQAEGIMGGVGGKTIEELALEISMMKSVYRTVHLDTEAEFDRVGIPLASVPEIMDRFHERMAAAADIPVTRLMGRSPAGMNATGESDAENYAKLVAAKQESLRSGLKRLDEVLAKHVGLSEPPDYSWPSVMEISDKDEAEAAKLKAEAWAAVVGAYAADESEMRAALSGDTIFGDLSGPPPEAPDPLEMIEKEAEVKAKHAPPPSSGGPGGGGGGSKGGAGGAKGGGKPAKPAKK